MTIPFPTTNTSSSGTVVYCQECHQTATIVRTNLLGLRYGPVMECEDSVLRGFCGTGLKHYCQHIILFMQTLQEQGEDQAAIDAFVDAWFATTDRETQRQPVYNGLVDARATNDAATILAYINNVKQMIGL